MQDDRHEVIERRNADNARPFCDTEECEHHRDGYFSRNIGRCMAENVCDRLTRK